MERLHLHLPVALLHRLREVARSRGVSVAEVVRGVLQAWAEGGGR